MDLRGIERAGGGPALPAGLPARETQRRPAVAPGRRPPAVPPGWWPVLARLRVPAEAARTVARRAAAARVPFQAELVASGLVSEAVLLRALAEELGLPFRADIDPARLVMRDRDALAALRRPRGAERALMLAPGGGTVHVLAPTAVDIVALREHLRRFPGIAARLCITPPAVLRRAVAARVRGPLTRRARERLFETRPELSARFVLVPWQAAAFGAAAVALPVALALAPVAALLALHGLFSLFFFACVGLRLAVSRAVVPPLPRLAGPLPPAEMPVYTVLVALYREAEIVPDLLVALGKLVWPRAKLEIKLVCEADDAATLAAIEAHALRPHVELIRVPPGLPRTKPKALQYALAMTSGLLVVLYDAEDRPHPLQLLEAWQRFCSEGADLACLQAPLVIANAREARLAALFALEYAALFRGILPWLARRGLVLPLGGTSNHFRRTALEAAGAWDPYNVTEDADLGLRLARFGYRVSTIGYPTYEDAPDAIGVWLPQRTRWFKGWLQTWLVHMRRPLRLARELGPGSFLVSQILFAGMVVSALVHPLFVVTALAVALRLALGHALPDVYSGLMVLDVVNVVGGYGAFLALGWLTLEPARRRGFWRMAVAVPGYWVLMSLAAWRAAWQLFRHPHLWEKTPHKRSSAARRLSRARAARSR